MLGISLLFVGIVLTHNGVMFMSKKDGEPLIVQNGKSIAVFNLIVGSLIVLMNLIWFGTHLPSALASEGAVGLRHIEFQNIAAGFLFGVTYIFIGLNILLKLDMRPFGWYCLGVAIFALIIATDSFVAFASGAGIDLLILGILWILWFPLWLAGTLEFNLGITKMGKVFPWMSIIGGIISAFIPAIALLLGWWPLLS
ncbi:MAG: hypothetical protein FWC82_01365 [Firmicutes bacterium]|nr:hypothetical protein [Bacillota bacterium]